MISSSGSFHFYKIVDKARVLIAGADPESGKRGGGGGHLAEKKLKSKKKKKQRSQQQ